MKKKTKILLIILAVVLAVALALWVYNDVICPLLGGVAAAGVQPKCELF